MKHQQSQLNFSRESSWIIEVRHDANALVEALVDVLEGSLRNRLLNSTTKPLGLATGRTMEPIYTALTSRLMSWTPSDLERLLKGWSSFNLDEYVGVEICDERSFNAYMKRHLGGPLRLTPEQVNLPNGAAKDPYLEARLYQKKLLGHGGIGLLLLGLGINGHVGFNEPPCGPDESCRVVKLSDLTRKQNAFAFGNAPNQVPSEAITLGFTEILSADEIHLVVIGSDKATVLNKLLNGSISEHLPASWLRFHKNVHLWVDQATLLEKTN